MKHFFKMIVATAAIAASLSAHAALLDVTFSGIVQSQNGSSFAVNAPITGEFVFDTLSSRYVTFTIGDQSVATGFASSAAITPNYYSAIYQAQVSPVSQSGISNSSFSVDLEAITAWPSYDAAALLTNANQLSTNLDTANSTFSFYSANSDGTSVQSLTSSLTIVQVTPVPEPTSVALMLLGLAAMGVCRARRPPV